MQGIGDTRDLDPGSRLRAPGVTMEPWSESRYSVSVKVHPIHSITGYTASVTREGRWFVAQCLEIDVASQGRSAKSALDDLAEALQLIHPR